MASRPAWLMKLGQLKLAQILRLGLAIDAHLDHAEIADREAAARSPER
jgi:hypothetical protein